MFSVCCSVGIHNPTVCWPKRSTHFLFLCATINAPCGVKPCSSRSLFRSTPSERVCVRLEPQPTIHPTKDSGVRIATDVLHIWAEQGCVGCGCNYRRHVRDVGSSRTSIDAQDRIGRWGRLSAPPSHLLHRRHYCRTKPSSSHCCDDRHQSSKQQICCASTCRTSCQTRHHIFSISSGNVRSERSAEDVDGG